MPKSVKRRKNKLAGRYRNRWPDEAEISGRMIPKWVADSCRNRWPDHPEIRSNYQQCVFVLTSNLGQHVLSSTDLKQALPDLSAVLQKGSSDEGLTPEFISRLSKGYVGLFKPLSPSNLLKIASNEFEQFKRHNTSEQIRWPECFPELVLMSLGGSSSPRTIRPQFGKLKTELIRFATANISWNQTTRVVINSASPREPLRAAILMNHNFSSAEFDTSSVEYFEHSNTDMLLKSHQQKPFDAILTDVSGCKLLVHEKKGDEDLPTYLLVNVQDYQTKNVGLHYRRSIRYNPENSNFLSDILDVVSKQKYLCKVLPDLKRRRSTARYDLAYEQNQAGHKVYIKNFQYEQSFDARDFDNHFMKLAEVPQSNLSDLMDDSELKKQLEEIKNIISSKIWEKIEIPKGYLLHGAPGGGKTFAARALAGSCKIPFFQVNAADLTIGDVTRNINHLFNTAEKYAPSIIFIDELDSIAFDRAKAPPALRIAVNSLLTKLDGFSKEQEPVIVIGATNLVTQLDPALLRAGRLERVIEVELPNDKQRTKAIGKALTKYEIQMSDTDVMSLARNTQGMTLKAIENLFRDSAIQRLAIDENPSDPMLAKSVNKLQALGMYTDITQNDEYMWRVSVHETGHALSIKLSGSCFEVEQVAIWNSCAPGGFTKTNALSLGNHIMTRENLNYMVQHKLAGRAAEEAIFGFDNVSDGATNDLKECTEMVRHFFFKCGMSSNFSCVDLSQLPTLQQKTEQDILEFIQGCYQHVLLMIKQNQEQLLVVARSLHERKQLSKQELDALWNGRAVAIMH